MITNMENYQKVTDLYPILCDEEEVCCECKLEEIILCILEACFMFPSMAIRYMLKGTCKLKKH